MRVQISELKDYYEAMVRRHERGDAMYARGVVMSDSESIDSGSSDPNAKG